jgi:hypothetical protein
MRILFVSNGNFKHSGNRTHCFEARIRNGLIRNGHHVFFLSDRDKAKEQGILGRIFAKKMVNNYFLKVCKNFKPDMILLGQADFITLESLQEAKKFLSSIKIAAYCIDIVFCDHIEQTIVSKLPALDAVFCTTAGKTIKQKFKKSNNIVAYIPNPTDISIDYLECEKNTSQYYDVFWAMRGTRYSYEDDPRYYYPRVLAKEKDVKIDYYGFDNKPILMNYRYYEAIANCKGGLNISVSRLNEYPNNDPSSLYLYSSDRLAHYAGCGLLLYILRGFCLEEIFEEDKQAVYFSSIEELKDKIIFYSQHDQLRQNIASASANFYRQYFNEREVARYIVEVTFNTKTITAFGWNTDIFN